MNNYHSSHISSLEQRFDDIKKESIEGIQALLSDASAERIDFMGEVEFDDGTTIDLSSFWDNCARPYASVYDYCSDCIYEEEVILCSPTDIETENGVTLPYEDLTVQSCFQVYRCLSEYFNWKENYNKASQVKSHFTPFIDRLKAKEQSFLHAYYIQDQTDDDFHAILYVWQNEDGSYDCMWGDYSLYQQRGWYPWSDILQQDEEFTKTCMEAVIAEYNILD